MNANAVLRNGWQMLDKVEETFMAKERSTMLVEERKGTIGHWKRIRERGTKRKPCRPEINKAEVKLLRDVEQSERVSDGLISLRANIMEEWRINLTAGSR
jgi:hypothetical protein